MNTCWKCGKEISQGQVECEYGCGQRAQWNEKEKQALTRILESFNRRRKIDWSKVQSAEDVILILSTIFAEATIAPDSVEEQKLEKFLEPKKESGK